MIDQMRKRPNNIGQSNRVGFDRDLGKAHPKRIHCHSAGFAEFESDESMIGRGGDEISEGTASPRITDTF
jgi:hypothetical protein